MLDSKSKINGSQNSNDPAPVSPLPHSPVGLNLPLIGITMGDPTGIGPEVIVKALSKEGLYRFCRPVVLGDLEVMARTVKMQGLRTEVETIGEIPEKGYGPQKIFVASLTRLKVNSLHFGKPDRECGRAMIRYVEEAVRWVQRGDIDAITTCPINKKAIGSAGYPFPGHTEFLAHLAKVPSVAMMFLGPKWRVVLTTTHLPIQDVSRRITRHRILSTIRLTHEGLQRHFRIPHPRIAVLGLNPHCGEEGLFGKEEKRKIIPAIEEARGGGIGAEGPFPADSFFDLSGLTSYDAVIAMYHDQGLIPVKMFGFRESVNFTLGLPFIRTSVGHGTAYDIAGKGIGDPTNLAMAIQTASNLL